MKKTILLLIILNSVLSIIGGIALVESSHEKDCDCPSIIRPSDMYGPINGDTICKPERTNNPFK